MHSQALVLAASADQIILKLNDVIINPLIKLLFALAFLYFVYGLVEFMMHRGDAEGVTKGKQHMIWGVIGLTIMIVVFGIIRFIVNFLDGL